MNQTSPAMSALRYNLSIFNTSNSFICIPSHDGTWFLKQTPLSLEINTSRSKLRDFVEKIVKAKLGINFPLIMHGSNLLYEVGDDLDEVEVANYAANLEKVKIQASSVTLCSSPPDFCCSCNDADVLLFLFFNIFSLYFMSFYYLFLSCLRCYLSFLLQLLMGQCLP